MSELAITGEEMCTPLFTTASSVEISMLTCVAGCGLGMTMTNAPVEVASDVVIFGAGPVGLSAVMGAKVKGASRIIVVEPIPVPARPRVETRRNRCSRSEPVNAGVSRFRTPLQRPTTSRTRSSITFVR